MNQVVGIDISKKEFDVNMLHRGKEKSKKYSNTQKGFEDLLSFLKRCQVEEALLCMEATGTYHEELAFFLSQKNFLVAVVNPALIAAFAKSLNMRHQTDRLDAKVIRLYAERMNPPLWKPPSTAVRELRRLSRRLEALTAMQTEEKNREKTPGLIQREKESIDNLLGFLREEIDRLKQEVAELIEQTPDLKKQKELLESIPAVASWSAARLLAELPDLQCFQNARQLAAYAGLTPRFCESGSSVRHKERLSKMGSARLRNALFMPTWRGLKCNEVLIHLASRLRARPGKEKSRVIGACMRKLLHLIYGILKTGRPFDPQMAVVI